MQKQYYVIIVCGLLSLCACTSLDLSPVTFPTDTESSQPIEIHIDAADDYVALGTDNAIKVFSTANHREVWAVSVSNPVTALQFSQDGDILAVGSADGSVDLREVQSGAVLNSLTGITERIEQIIWSYESDRLAIRTSNPVEFLIWGGEQTQSIDAGDRLDRRIGVLAWSPTDPDIMLTGWENDITFWDLASGEELYTINTQRVGSIYTIVSMPETSTFVIGGADLLEFYDGGTDEHRMSIELDVTQSVIEVLPSDSGQVVAVETKAIVFAEDLTVTYHNEAYVWHMSTEDAYATEPSYHFRDGGQDIALTPSGDILYIASLTGVSIIDTRTGEVTGHIEFLQVDGE